MERKIGQLVYRHVPADEGEKDEDWHKIGEED